MDPKIWGAAVWRVIDAAADPKRWSNTENQHLLPLDLFTAICNSLPCEECRTCFSSFISTNTSSFTRRAAFTGNTLIAMNTLRQRIYEKNDSEPSNKDHPQLYQQGLAFLDTHGTVEWFNIKKKFNF